MLLVGISGSAYADEPLRLSYDEATIKLGSQPLNDSVNDAGSVAAKTQIVTIESGSDSESDVNSAFELAADAADAMNAVDAETYPFAARNTIVVRITDGKYKSYPAAYQILKNRLKPSASKTHVLSQEEAQRLTLLQKAHNKARGVGDYFKNRVTKTQWGLAVVRFTSGLGAATTAVIVSEGWPAPARLASILMAAAPTGLMSAGFTLFSDVYAKVITKPWIFSKAVDTAKDQSFVQAFLERIKTRAPLKIKARLNLPLYLDQYVKGLFLEFPFLMISGLSMKATTAGFVNLTTSFASPLSLAFEVSRQIVMNVGDVLLHVLGGIFSAAGGQLLLDQSSAIVSENLKNKIKEQFGEDSPEAQKKLARIQFGRDAFMVANSIFQVWVAIFAVQQHQWALDALKFYLGAGLLTRALVIPVENQNMAYDVAHPKNESAVDNVIEMAKPRNRTCAQAVGH